MLDEMTIFYIAVLLFFVCPIALVVTGIVSDQMTRRSHPENDQSNGQMQGPTIRSIR